MGLLEGDRFYILINGAPVTKPGVDGLLGGDQTVQASTNSSPEGAVFSFNPVERHLYSDGYFLGRNLLEDRSLLPKKIVWSRDPSYLLPVHTDENNPQKLRFSGGPLIVMNGQLFASLMGEEEPTVQLAFL